MTDSSIHIRRLTKAYRRGGEPLVVLDELDLEMEGSTFYALMGPSGSGKTTLLRVIAGLEHPDDGVVAFDSIFPGCYSGRWPHVHFEVYPTLASASTSKNALATSQLAFPEDICKLVYATDGYSASVRNLSQISLKTDNVFSDGWTLQMASLNGDVKSGYTATLTVGV